MKPLTREWVEKAEGDFITARRELRARKAPNYDAACFHAQQCAEKYLKARLQEEGTAFPRTHDLATLLDLLLPVEPSWTVMRSDLDRLISFAVEFRYPGTSADKAMARSAVDVCRNVRHRVRASLGLAP
jgi:HEPN domain-containing protein